MGKSLHLKYFWSKNLRTRHQISDGKRQKVPPPKVPEFIYFYSSVFFLEISKTKNQQLRVTRLISTSPVQPDRPLWEQVCPSEHPVYLTSVWFPGPLLTDRLSGPLTVSDTQASGRSLHIGRAYYSIALKVTLNWQFKWILRFYDWKSRKTTWISILLQVAENNNFFKKKSHIHKPAQVWFFFSTVQYPCSPGYPSIPNLLVSTSPVNHGVTMWPPPYLPSFFSSFFFFSNGTVGTDCRTSHMSGIRSSYILRLALQLVDLSFSS